MKSIRIVGVACSPRAGQSTHHALNHHGCMLKADGSRPYRLNSAVRPVY
jgi:hypothetical protein